MDMMVFVERVVGEAGEGIGAVNLQGGDNAGVSGDGQCGEGEVASDLVCS